MNRMLIPRSFPRSVRRLSTVNSKFESVKQTIKNDKRLTALYIGTSTMFGTFTSYQCAKYWFVGDDFSAEFGRKEPFVPTGLTVMIGVYTALFWPITFLVVPAAFGVYAVGVPFVKFVEYMETPKE